MQDKTSVEVALAESLDRLKSSEDRYHKMIIEVDEYAIILLDENGIIQTWNKGAQRIKQYNESEAIGRHFEMFYLPEDRATQLPAKLMKEAIETGRAIHEGWRLRKDRSKFWGSITLTALHDEKGGIIGFSKVTRDLTERKITEEKVKRFTEELQQRNEALHKSEERYHRMIGEVQDYAIILLNKNGDIESWNVGAERIKGYSAKEIIGKNFRIFYHPNDRQNKLPERLIGEATLNGKALHEGWRLRKDGSSFWGSIVITALHDTDGSVIGFSKVTRDLTEKKLAEDKIRDYAIQLEARNKELENFAYIASHDLQEPLRKIQSFTEVVQENLEDEEIVNRYFQKINDSAQRMSELIKSVLNYSRLSTVVELSKTDLQIVVNDVLNDLELTIKEKNAKISVEPLPIIIADRTQMHQLFLNLISNALKFTDKQPQINISSVVIPKNKTELPQDLLKSERYLQITVQDNGIGFEQEFADSIFSMFQRLHSKHEFAGTGIGLSICKKIINNHHGFIKGKGKVGKGATFLIYLPMP